VIDPEAHDARESPDSSTSDAETVIALGRLVYRFCKRSPELLACDPTTLWDVIFDSFDGDGDGRRLLARCEGTSEWEMAVLTARLIREVYAAGGLEQEPA
jgi:hypothetical protein